MKKRPILVGVDFSPITAAVLRRARALAGDGGALRLVHVIDTTLVPNADFVDGALIAECNAALAEEARAQLEACARSRDLDGARVESRCLRGRAADVLLEQSAGCSHLVVGAHARGLLGRLLVGSVAEEAARSARVPVLVVRERAEGSAAGRVLLALDPSEPSGQAILAAHDLAARTGARLEVVAVVPWPEPQGEGRAADRLRELRSKVIRMARFYARELVIAAVGAAVPVRVALGDPARRILARARASDVLVCGSHGRGALARLAFGSVATKLSRQAPCPVLFVPGPAVGPRSRTREAQGAGRA